MYTELYITCVNFQIQMAHTYIKRRNAVSLSLSWFLHVTYEWHTRPRINSCYSFVSVIVFVNVYRICLNVGQTIYPHHCDQWSEKTKVIWSTQKCYDD